MTTAPKKRTTRARKADAETGLDVEAGAPAAVAGPLRLDTTLTIREAATLVGQLRVAVAAGAPVLDGSGVEQVDTAALQALAAAAVAARQAGQPITWAGASRSLNGTAKLLGLVPVLGLPGAA